MMFTDKQAHSVWVNGEEAEVEVRVELNICAKYSSVLFIVIII